MYFLMDMCRLCLSTSSEVQDMCNDNTIEKVLSCISDLEFQEYLPAMICNNCLEQLDLFFDFRNRCLRSEFLLNKYFDKLSKQNVDANQNTLKKLQVNVVQSYGRSAKILGTKVISTQNRAPDENFYLAEDVQMDLTERVKLRKRGVQPNIIEKTSPSIQRNLNRIQSKKSNKEKQSDGVKTNQKKVTKKPLKSISSISKNLERLEKKQENFVNFEASQTVASEVTPIDNAESSNTVKPREIEPRIELKPVSQIPSNSSLTKELPLLKEIKKEETCLEELVIHSLKIEDGVESIASPSLNFNNSDTDTNSEFEDTVDTPETIENSLVDNACLNFKQTLNMNFKKVIHKKIEKTNQPRVKDLELLGKKKTNFENFEKDHLGMHASELQAPTNLQKDQAELLETPAVFQIESPTIPLIIETISILPNTLETPKSLLQNPPTVDDNSINQPTSDSSLTDTVPVVLSNSMQDTGVQLRVPSTEPLVLEGNVEAHCSNADTSTVFVTKATSTSLSSNEVNLNSILNEQIHLPVESVEPDVIDLTENRGHQSNIISSHSSLVVGTSSILLKKRYVNVGKIKARIKPKVKSNLTSQIHRLKKGIENSQKNTVGSAYSHYSAQRPMLKKVREEQQRRLKLRMYMNNLKTTLPNSFLCNSTVDTITSSVTYISYLKAEEKEYLKEYEELQNRNKELLCTLNSS